MAPCSYYFCVLLLVFPVCLGDEKFFDAVPKELRCSGCDLTVKVIDRMLTKHTKGPIERRVKDVLDHICEEKRFSISEYKPSAMVQVCEFMKEKHGPELTRELIKHYSQPQRSTYLEFSQHICLDIMRLCAGTSHKRHDIDKEDNTVLHFDSDTHGFTVVPGRNIKLPTPVKEKHHDEF